MEFNVTYTERVNANSRREAIQKIRLKHNSLNESNMRAEPLCPKGRDKGSSCYEQCAYRENGTCELDYRY